MPWQGRSKAGLTDKQQDELNAYYEERESVFEGSVRPEHWQHEHDQASLCAWGCLWACLPHLSAS